jgi:RNA polymerase sigma factor (sigma-70 family)
MPRPRWSLLDRLIRQLPPADADRVSDGDLLDRFARDRDQAAFELLVWRHGGFVLSTCRRILGDEHLAEDAFQATFLVLARKAHSLHAQNIPGWLHRVARRTSARAERRRRKVSARETVLAGEPPADESRPDRDLATVLDSEVGRLPERFRLPVVLCYLQNHTTSQAARLLGVPHGTVLSRLATARQKLAARLTRRGVTLPATLVSTSLASNQLVSATVRSAAAFAAGDTALTSAPTLLATEVMRMNAWKLPAAVAAAFALVAGVGTGVGVFASGAPKPVGQPIAQGKPADGPTGADAERQRDRKRTDTLKRLREYEDEVLARIHDLDRKQQDAARVAGDDVDVKVLRASLEQLDRHLLMSEGNGASTEKFVRELEDRLRTFDVNAVPNTMIENEVAMLFSTHESRRLLSARQQNLQDLSKTYTPDHAILKAAKAEVDAAKAEADKVKETLRVEAKKRIAERQQKDLQDRLQREKERGRNDAEDRADSRRKRVDLAQRIARAKSLEDANQLIEDELRVYRELRQQLLRQRLTLQIDLDGVTLPSAPAGLDAKVDQLMREVAELKAEIRRMEESKPPAVPPVPDATGRGNRGGRGGNP